MFNTLELYPVGTNLYNLALIQRGTYSRTGEFTADSTAPTGGMYDYIPINPSYTYQKTKRIYTIYFFDKDKVFIASTNAYNNLDTMIISKIPINAAYIRWSFVFNN